MLRSFLLDLRQATLPNPNLPLPPLPLLNAKDPGQIHAQHWESYAITDWLCKGTCLMHLQIGKVLVLRCLSATLKVEATHNLSKERRHLGK